MSLHVRRYEYTGTGSGGIPLLLIHGWAMHGGVWNGVAEQLSQHFPVLAVDLPGHGFSNVEKGEGGKGKGKTSALPSPFSLDAIVDELSCQFNEPLTLCGWSLGGQLALRWAQRKAEQVRRLVLVASTPCFARRQDWLCAMPVETLTEFGTALQQDYAQTLRRFLALQLRGSERERELLATLRNTLFSHGEPDLSALQTGLEILRDCDLRAELPDIKQAALVIAGERDTLTPPLASQYLASHLADARLVTVKGAAHAPFLSHQAEFSEQLINFLSE
jgi:pimeloyl-[acyl-carrier protein] methyl ester esterase